MSIIMHSSLSASSLKMHGDQLLQATDTVTSYSDRLGTGNQHRPFLF